MLKLTDAVKHILIINILFFIATQIYGEYMYQLFSLWFPKNENFALWQIASHMFMHGGFMHILFNMYALWAFGAPLEQMWGRNKFLFFYLSAGLGAALIHTGVNYYYFNEGYQQLINSGVSDAAINEFLNTPTRYMRADLVSMYEAYNVPAVGASGAIYGILVAFAMMFPNSELFLIFIPFPIKAKYFIPVLIGLDLFSGVTGYSIFGSGIAHFAHVGGALFGFIMMWYWKKSQFKNNRWDL
ncbi:rhomboid family intramembrane serine protease [Ascidiimonas aurantiaca]|uniref:rhomboid family intramembrane serine protease n=1 Tax=Ascidiimonas aurantiaca TaxID=1685432 RepID=UPI0030EF79EE